MNIMTDEVSVLEIVKAKSAATQIADYIRQQILTGELQPGDKLPATSALAKQWGSHVATVHEGLQQLTKEGLLLRRPRVGTIVRPHDERLTCVAVYQPVDITQNPSMRFVAEVDNALRAATGREHIEVRMLIDRRAANEQSKLLPQLRAMIRAHEINAVVAPVVDSRHLTWLRQLPLPTAYITSATDARGVNFDPRQLAQLSITQLVQQGCQSVSLISSVSRAGRGSGPGQTTEKTFYQHFTDAAHEAGLTLVEDWYDLPGVAVGDADHEELGYRQFQKMWDQPRRPAGLVVYPDGVVRGVIAAVLERQVRVPEELKLVLHRNAEIKLFCPLPATFVVSSAAAAATALIDQVQRQIRGERCEMRLIGYQLEPAARRTTE